MPFNNDFDQSVVHARALNEEPDIFNQFQYIQEPATVLNANMTPNYSKTALDRVSVFDFGDEEEEQGYDAGTVGIDDEEELQVIQVN